MMNHLKLGNIVKDSATGLKGMLTHLQIGSDRSQFYTFQPRGINPEDGQPVKCVWLTIDRLINGDTAPEYTETNIPVDMLGSIATDDASGFKGTVIALTLHINGCIHALIQPKGVIEKNGALIEPCDFDIRRLIGNKVPKLTEKQLEKSKIKKPSPIVRNAYRPPICGVAYSAPRH